jgi:hypothetical protein
LPNYLLVPRLVEGATVVWKVSAQNLGVNFCNLQAGTPGHIWDTPFRLRIRDMDWPFLLAM